MTERYKKLWKRLSQRIVEERCGVPDNLPWGDNERTGGIMIPPFVIQWLVLQNCALSSNFSCAKLFIFQVFFDFCDKNNADIMKNMRVL